MKRVSSICLLLVFLSGAAVWALEKEGSTPEDLAAMKLPARSDMHVAVLPFWGREERQVRLARSCTMLNLMRHGFRLAPEGSKSLASVVRQTDAVLKRDAKWEPLARLDAHDVARLSKELGARWAIYGEFGDLHVRSEKGKVLPRKVCVIDLRLVLVDTKSGKILYWTRVKDSYSEGGGLWPAKASTLERRLLTRTLNGIFDDIASGLPDHYAGTEVTPQEVKRLAATIE